VYAENLAVWLVDQGHEVVVLASQHRQDLALEEKDHGIKIVRVPITVQIGRGPVMAQLPLRAIELIQWADVINCHLPQFECLLFVLAGRRLGKEAILTHHTDLSGWRGLVNRISEGAVSASQALAASFSSAIVTYTEDYANHSTFLQRHRSKVTSIYPPIRDHPVDPELRRDLKKKIGQHENIVGFAGRIVRQKGIPHLLNAMDYLVDKAHDLALVLAGPYDEVVGEDHLGELRAQLSVCRHAVVFLGPLKPHEMASFYDLIDVLVLPSDDRLESFGLVQVEAMYQGCPVVATDLPGVRVPVRETGMGKIVPPSDPASLSRAILDVLTERAQYVKPRSTILQTFDLHKTCERYEELFNRSNASQRDRSGVC
jgi:glycosyltransferase involved in cell wall biosynthesis